MDARPASAWTRDKADETSAEAGPSDPPGSATPGDRGGDGRPEGTDALVRGAAASDPAVGLAAVRALRRLTERLERLQVDAARAEGWSWQTIADQLQVSRQAVHQKYGRRARGPQRH